MRPRLGTVIFAMLGVLLHVAALVRHHGIVLASHIEHQAVAASLASLCLGGETHSGTTTDVSHLPSPVSAPGDCPICSGQTPVFALASPLGQASPVRFWTAVQWAENSRRGGALPDRVWPPARGPPASAVAA